MIDPAAHPPAFPPHLRALDPLLAREDTNGLFQAFRSRRTRIHKQFGPIGEQLRAMVLPTLGMLLTWLFAKLPWSHIGILLASVAALGALLLFFGDSAKQVPDLWTSDIFGNPPPMEPSEKNVLKDLWLVPATGAEVAEAIYLEDRESLLDAAQSGAITHGILVPIFYILLISPPLAELHRQILPALLVGLLSVQYYRSLSMLEAGRLACGTVTHVLNGWQAELGNEAWPRKMPDLRQAHWYWVYLLLPMWSARRHSGLWAESPFPVQEVLTVSAFLAALNVFYAMFLRRRRLNGQPGDFAPLAARANELYEPFVRKRLALEGPDSTEVPPK